MGLLAWPASADTLQEVTTEGLSFAKTPGVAIAAETVAVTIETVTMHYQITSSAKDAVVMDMTLHLPAIDLSDPDTTYALPSDDPVNFVGAQVLVDTKPTPLTFRQSADFEHKDVTKRLTEANLPVMPGSGFKDKLSGAPPELLLKLVADGLLRPNGTSADGGQNLTPAWTVKTSATRKQRIEAGQPLSIDLRFSTSLGASQDTVLRKALRSGTGLEATVDQYRKDFCLEDTFLSGVDKLAGTVSENAAGLQERRISMRLAPPATADVPVGSFQLTIDKGKPDNLISTCLSKLRKTGATTFEFDAHDAAPPPRLRLLLVGKF